MSRSRDWWAPLTGVAFLVVCIVGFAVGGDPKSADEPVNEIVDFYVSNKDSVQISAILAALAGLLLIYFGAHLRGVLHAAGGPGETLSLVAFVGLAIVALAFAIDGTIAFSLAESAEDIDPTAVQALQALWDNDFLPIVLGVTAFLTATGISAIRTGVLPAWLGWLMIALAVAGLTPVGFVTAIASALLVPVLGVVFARRARSAPAAA
jgi:hypothetical protein